jgi:thiamine-monophosphate kinase
MREFDLLRSVYRRNALLPGFVRVPPGDDMAVLELADPTVLVAVDQVVAGRHVRPDEDPALVGRKAVARNVSDVAAMAAVPTATVVACLLPTDYGERRALDLFEGLRSSAQVFGCPLVGGDLAVHADASAPLVVSVTILAAPAWPGARCVERTGAVVGAGLYATGAFGRSLDRDGGGHHLRFEPRVREGIELLRMLGPRLCSMIDVSDGLGRDAAHLVEHDAALAVELDAAAIPRRHGASLEEALGDGEDYELLFTATGPVPSEVCGTPVTRIGSITQRHDGGAMVVAVEEGGRRFDATSAGWEHRTR